MNSGFSINRRKEIGQLVIAKKEYTFSIHFCRFICSGQCDCRQLSETFFPMASWSYAT